MLAYRLGDAAGRFEVFHPKAGEDGGRWNSPGSPVLYAAPVFSTAMLEKLAHLGGIHGRIKQRYVVTDIPDDIEQEHVGRGDLPGWHVEKSRAARKFGDLWLAEQRTPVLFVPSVLSPFDDNLLINLQHPDARRILPSDEHPFVWDDRLLR